MLDSRAVMVMTWVVLAIWIAGPWLAIATPPKQHDPQRGMAVGLLIGVSIIGGVVGLMYAAGLMWNLWLLKRVPNWISVFVVALVLVNAVRWVIEAAKGR
ncbi:MAG: hypothetical protein AB7G11_06670 [Phycisphaerales bacterium]